MEEEIQKRVIELTKQNQDRMVEEFGIQSSLTEEDNDELVYKLTLKYLQKGYDISNNTILHVKNTCM